MMQNARKWLYAAPLLVLAGLAQAGLGLEGMIAKARYLYEQDSRGENTKALLDPLRTAQDPGKSAITLFSGPDSRRDALGLDTRYIGTGLRFETHQSFAAGNQTFGINLSLGNKPENTSASALAGTEMALKFRDAEIYAGSQPRHWGPGWMGSLIMDQAAANVWSVGVRRPVAVQSDSAWLSWIGPWAGDFFIGRLEGHIEPSRPYLIGMRVLLAPTKGLEIGLSRALQWGGSGREQSWSSFWNGMLGKDNTGSGGITQANEPGNQLAGFDVRYSHPVGDRHSAAIYGQVIGEDESGYLPTKLMHQAGAEFAQSAGGVPWRIFIEGTQTKAGVPGVAYRHGVYQQGFTNRSFPLAYPLGGDVQLASAGVLASRANSAMVLMVHSGKTLTGSQLYSADGSIHGAQLGLMLRDRNLESGLMLSHFKTPEVKENTAQLFARFKF